MKYGVFTKKMGFGLCVLSLMTSCDSSSKWKNNLQMAELQNCPETVTVSPEAYGKIVLDWDSYAPKTNTYVTVTIVPHTADARATVGRGSNSTGSFILEGYVKGTYSVYYTIQPGSSEYPPCSGAQADITFS